MNSIPTFACIERPLDRDADAASDAAAAAAHARRLATAPDHVFFRFRLGFNNVTLAAVNLAAAPDCARREAGASVVAAAAATAAAAGDDVLIVGDLGSSSSTYEDATRGVDHAANWTFALLLDLDGDGEDDLEELGGRARPAETRWTDERTRAMRRHVFASPRLAAATTDVAVSRPVAATADPAKNAADGIATLTSYALVVRMKLPRGHYTAEPESFAELLSDPNAVVELVMFVVFGSVFLVGCFKLAFGKEPEPSWMTELYGFGIREGRGLATTKDMFGRDLDGGTEDTPLGRRVRERRERAMKDMERAMKQKMGMRAFRDPRLKPWPWPWMFPWRKRAPADEMTTTTTATTTTRTSPRRKKTQ